MDKPLVLKFDHLNVSEEMVTELIKVGICFNACRRISLWKLVSQAVARELLPFSEVQTVCLISVAIKRATQVTTAEFESH